MKIVISFLHHLVIINESNHNCHYSFFGGEIFLRSALHSVEYFSIYLSVVTNPAAFGGGEKNYHRLMRS